MLFDRIIPKKYHIKNEVCALEVQYNDSQITYNYVILKNTGKKLEIVQKGSLKDDLELPKQVLKLKLPLVLVLNGKGVIVKKVNVLEGEFELKRLIEDNIPALNLNDLMVQVYMQSDNTAFVCFCRKDIVNGLINELVKSKYDVVNVLIGASSILGMKPFWNDLNCIPSTLQLIELRNGQIESLIPITKEVSSIKIGDLILDKENTLAFSAGVSYLTQRKIVQNADKSFDKIYNDHIDRNKLKVLTLLLVAMAFLMAVTNVIFYTNYFDKNNKLEAELGVYQSKHDQINQLLSAYESKKSLIENAGLLNKNKLSEYADKIGECLPQEVILNQLYFNPLKESESKDSLIEFKAKHLTIKGNCNKSLIINDWLNVLKMQDFVKEVNLQKFTYNNEGVAPNFEIEIVTR